MTTATDGFGTILAELEQGGGGGGGGVIEQVGNSNIRAVRTGEVTNGEVGEGASYNAMFGTGNGEGAFVAGTFNAVLGGDSNYIDADYSVISGGDFNWMQQVDLGEAGTYSCQRQFIGGGSSNWVQQNYGFVGGGSGNSVYTNDPSNEDNRSSVVVGGSNNSVVGGYSFIGGGYTNSVGEDNEGTQTVVRYSTIVGGQFNANRGFNAFIGGGTSNNIMMVDLGDGNTPLSFGLIVGGEGNTLRQHTSVIVGGKFNTVFSNIPNDDNNHYSALVGGYNNNLQGGYGFIGGGTSNRMGRNEGDTYYEPRAAVIVGGQSNVNEASWSVIVGGEGNSLREPTATQSFIGGGQSNTMLDHHGFLGGGESNLVLGPSSEGGANGFQVLVGGYQNSVYGQFNFIGAGHQNRIGDENEGQGAQACVVAGGDTNWINASIKYSAIGGGSGNTIGNDYAVISGGQGNIVSGPTEGGEASGLQAKAGAANYQRAFAGGQNNGEGAGARQYSEVVFRGDTDGSDGNTVYLGAGGLDAAPTFAGISMAPGKSYSIVAECLARGPGMSSYQVVRGLVHVDDDTTEHNAAGAADTKIEYGSPPAGWVFSVFSETGGLRVTFTVGSGNTQIVKAVASVRIIEIGVPPG